MPSEALNLIILNIAVTEHGHSRDPVTPSTEKEKLALKSIDQRAFPEGKTV